MSTDNPPMHHFISQEDIKLFAETIDLQQEEKVRRQWLISFFTFSALSAYASFLILNDLATASATFKGVITNFRLTINLILALLGITPWFWITYHCAYKKQGTAWLMWILISMPLREFPGLIIELAQASRWNIINNVFLAVSLTLGILFWINCYRLQKVNSAREYQKVLAFKKKYGSDANGFCS